MPKNDALTFAARAYEVAHIAHNGNHYWTWNNRANLYSGATYGAVGGSFGADFQSAAWHQVKSQEILLKADNSNSKYLRYDTILYSQTLGSRYPASNQIVGPFEPNVTVGGWWYQCGSLGMRLMSPDFDGSGWYEAAVGFVWKSNRGYGCSWDDSYGGVNSSNYPSTERWGGYFYPYNFTTAVNAFVR